MKPTRATAAARRCIDGGGLLQLEDEVLVRTSLARQVRQCPRGGLREVRPLNRRALHRHRHRHRPLPERQVDPRELQAAISNALRATGKLDDFEVAALVHAGVMKKVHLRHPSYREQAACGQPYPTLLTDDRDRVTCGRCSHAGRASASKVESDWVAGEASGPPPGFRGTAPPPRARPSPRPSSAPPFGSSSSSRPASRRSSTPPGSSAPTPDRHGPSGRSPDRRRRPRAYAVRGEARPPGRGDPRNDPLHGRHLEGSFEQAHAAGRRRDPAVFPLAGRSSSGNCWVAVAAA